MRKPDSLVQLLEDLREEGLASSVGVQPKSKAVVYLTPEDRTGLTFSGEECLLLFHSQATVERFMDAFEADLGEASLELYELNIESELITLLETIFSSVDEM